MCRDKDHGDGRRCPSDTSEARRQRRKAASALKSAKPGKRAPKPTLAPVSIEDLKQQAADLRAKAYAPAPKGLSQSKYDEQIEKQITSFGSAIATEAERLAGYDKKKLNDASSDLADKLYNPFNKRLDAAEQKLNEADDAISAILKEKGLKEEFNWKRSHQVYEKLTDEQKALLTEDEVKQIHRVAELEDERDAIMATYGEVDAEWDAQKAVMFDEANKKLAKAYQSLISQIRPVGGNAQFKSKDLAVTEIMANTVNKHYPSEWIQLHNDDDGQSIELKATSDRAYYSTAALSETEDDGIVKPKTQTKFLSVTPENADKMMPLFPGEVTRVTTASYRGDKMTSFIYEGQEETLYSEETHGKLVDGKPQGEGWVKKPSIQAFGLIEAESFKNDDEAIDFLLTPRWVKPETTTKKIGRELVLYKPEVVEDLSKDNKDLFNWQEATALHEFGHRVEDILPNNILPRQEKAFLKRRSGKRDSEMLENMQQITRGEFGHKAGLVDSYMGRDYFTDENYEVFTTGIESIYGGNYGGLLGNSVSIYSEDKDHRGFTLGVLATL